MGFRHFRETCLLSVSRCVRPEIEFRPEIKSRIWAYESRILTASLGQPYVLQIFNHWHCVALEFEHLLSAAVIDVVGAVR